MAVFWIVCVVVVVAVALVVLAVVVLLDIVVAVIRIAHLHSSSLNAEDVVELHMAVTFCVFWLKPRFR